ncbi:MAG: aminotransferase class I/II-fold pyridoxal phosphate-dependent enzyme [Nitrosopumilaceae archaeon]|nr:histidinol-phosphate aminotransferase family protein [Nitrosopumilaceae archaeon]NIT99965.1 histidinol-phosphate aminotransferase family protein [Nitrosopumilaceae archaeon]NIU86320.1 aminotransferase class I/II-fold pyridoxal phosphate-dependent enzyme [Nitrosopumilaceae archaeon]NIV65075.1 aminotransferase class I/II-fold pyridoxal phosphate-dependent enzyme [Nitrosopumilaceae archaeon]NIX60568.1 aminotransferase class I/II-fold pyridoxal phosphate-dependent enzyme [Nitrosopumilaceae archa
MNFHFYPKIKNHTKVHHGGLGFGSSNNNILDFSSNISPKGTPKRVAQAIRRNVKAIERYPDPASIRLRKRIAKYHGILKSHIVVGNGAVEIIYTFCKGFVSNKTPVLIPIPTFGEYEAAAKLNSGKISFFKTLDLNRNLEKLLLKIPNKGCLFLCNPNNPTGVLVSKENMIKIINKAYDKSTIVFIDECFMELTPKSHESLISKVKNYKNLFILRSLTKSFGLAGIRLGYGIGSPEIVSILDTLNMPWNVNALAQHAGIAALDCSNELVKVNEIIEKESKYLKRKISAISGFQCFDSSTNFILIKTELSSKLIQKKLLKKKILIRDCSTIRGLDNHHIRIAIRNHKDNQQLVKELARLN